MALEFDHVALESSSIHKDIDFLRGAIPSLEVLYEDATWGFLAGAGVKVALVSPGQHPSHLAFKVNTREELQELARHHNVGVVTHRDKSESFYIQTPSGASIEVVYYAPKH